MFPENITLPGLVPIFSGSVTGSSAPFYTTAMFRQTQIQVVPTSTTSYSASFWARIAGATSANPAVPGAPFFGILATDRSTGTTSATGSASGSSALSSKVYTIADTSGLEIMVNVTAMTGSLMIFANQAK